MNLQSVGGAGRSIGAMMNPIDPRRVPIFSVILTEAKLYRKRVTERSKPDRIDDHPGWSRKGADGVVLCGGKSTRFGSSKAFYSFESVTLVTRALHVLQPFVDAIGLSISANSDDDWPDVPLIRDVHTGIGPIGGIHAAMCASEKDWMIVLPVDMPLMSRHSLRRLTDAAHGDVDAAVAASSDGRLHPLCGVYRRTCIPQIEQAILEQIFAVRRLLSRLNNVRYVTLPNEELRNVNRMEDLP